MLHPVFAAANLGNSIEYSQQKRENLGDLINETLEKLEMTGGEDAYSMCFAVIRAAAALQRCDSSCFLHSQPEVHGSHIRIRFLVNAPISVSLCNRQNDIYGDCCQLAPRALEDICYPCLHSAPSPPQPQLSATLSAGTT